MFLVTGTVPDYVFQVVVVSDSGRCLCAGLDHWHWNLANQYLVPVLLSPLKCESFLIFCPSTQYTGTSSCVTQGNTLLPVKPFHIMYEVVVITHSMPTTSPSIPVQVSQLMELNVYFTIGCMFVASCVCLKYFFLTLTLFMR